MRILRFTSSVSGIAAATAVFAALGLFALAAPAKAQLLGTNVTGTLAFGNDPTNYFSASNGFVPAGYGNSSPGTNTVTIAEPLTEFGFSATLGSNTANFTGSQLTITSVSNNGFSADFTMTFTDSAFTGLTLSTVSDSFGGTISRSGNTLTFNAPLLNTSGSVTRVAVFSLTAPPSTAAPEPSSLALLVPVAGLAGMVFRKRKPSK